MVFVRASMRKKKRFNFYALIINIKERYQIMISNYSLRLLLVIFVIFLKFY